MTGRPPDVPLADPDGLLHGDVLVAVPHMDDEVLACGGTLARLRSRDRVHLVYATSGRGSEDLGMPGVTVDPSIDMGAIRREESLRALDRLGIPRANAHFLDVRDYTVAANTQRVEKELRALVDRIRPACLLAPFRYDRHTDHVALSRCARAVAAAADCRPRLLEYFVYYRWKMLPRADVRAYLKPALLRAVDLASVAELKKNALRDFTSQATCYFDWQTRPVLSAELINETSDNPELFLCAPPGARDGDLFTVPVAAIRLVHALEPVLKRRKDQLSFLLKRARGRRN
jgi:LmbE family N-acetylglucosaminyl deacetylase